MLRLTADTTQIKAISGSVSQALRNVILVIGALVDDGRDQPQAVAPRHLAPSR